MNDLAVPNEPPYLNRCRDLDFDELYLFITDSLEKPSDSSNGWFPHSQTEFERVLAMLGEKADPSAPKRRYLTEGQELRLLLDKRNRTEEFLRNKHHQPRSKKDNADAKRTLERLEQEITELESQFSRSGAGFRQHGFPKPLTHLEMLERLRRKVERHFSPDVEIIQLQWEAVPGGPAPADTVMRIYTEKQRHNPRIRYDGTRLEKVKTLKPKKGYMGRQKSEWYVIFTFDHTQKALMECPIYGNAIFIIHSNLEPERWLLMNKQELIEHPEVIKILHQGENWFERVREELGTLACSASKHSPTSTGGKMM